AEWGDIIEIGIPYSDPLADGTTIQKASVVALSQGIKTPQVLELISDLRRVTDTPFVIMTYYNVIYKYGLDVFAKAVAGVGVDGVIIPDLPPEEAHPWCSVAEANSIDTIFLLAPTSTEDRIRKVASACRGFIYCVSLTGVTGVREALSITLPHFISRVRVLTDKPLAVGFGISSPEHAREVAKIADGVIIGSALIDLIDKAKDERGQVASVMRFVKEIREALARV
ncbi:MAG: tryptophan synthase subunit alpha, partial [Actinomycetota bacterium]